MSETYIREELDRIKTSQLLSHIGSSAGPQKKNRYIYMECFNKRT